MIFSSSNKFIIYDNNGFSQPILYPYFFEIMDAYILDESHFLCIYLKDLVGIIFINQ